MNAKPLSESVSAIPAKTPETPSGKKDSSLPQPLSRRFYRDHSGWFVNSGDGKHGPYADKAEAQTALMYYSLRTVWPNEKELREFVRVGK